MVAHNGFGKGEEWKQVVCVPECVENGGVVRVEGRAGRGDDKSM